MSALVPPRRVVQVVRSDSFAGVERYIADVAGELSARGWDVVVVGGNPARMSAELPRGVRFLAATQTHQVARELWSIGSCAVVHAHMTAAEVPAVALKRRHHGAVVVTRHFPGRRGSSVLGRAAAPFIAKHVDAQIAVSEYVAARVEEPSHVLRSGVRVGSDVLLEREHVVTVLQRLEPEKRTDVAIRAWAQAGLGSQGWRLDVVGAGSEGAALRRMAHDLGVVDSVRFVGATATPRDVLARSAVLIAPTPVEALGLVVLEAMAEATPVLAADAGAHRETLGDAGVYFAADDVAACARELAVLAAEPARRTQLGAAVRARQRELFDLRAHVGELEILYESVAAR